MYKYELGTYLRHMYDKFNFLFNDPCLTRDFTISIVYLNNATEMFITLRILKATVRAEMKCI